MRAGGAEGDPERDGRRTLVNGWESRLWRLEDKHLREGSSFRHSFLCSNGVATESVWLSDSMLVVSEISATKQRLQHNLKEHPSFAPEALLKPSQWPCSL